MSKISDELRQYCKDLYKGGPNYMTLTAIADRIDTEMVELPRGKDGRPIRMGETVFTNDDPMTLWSVRSIELRLDREPSIGIESGGINTYRPPSCLTHERPDSWECIAQELDDMSENFRTTDKESFSALLDISDRIRRLAEEREHECE